MCRPCGLKKILLVSTIAFSVVGLTEVEGTAQPTVSLFSSASVISENNGVATLFVRISPAPAEDLIVTFAIQGTATPDDYVLNPTTMTIPAGQTQGQTRLTALPDALDEPKESVVIGLDLSRLDFRATRSSITLTIIDTNPDTTVVLSTDKTTILEAGGEAVIKATTNTVLDVPIIVTLTLSGAATEGVDYTLSDATLTIPPNQTEGTLRLTALDDQIFDFGEQVTLTIGEVTNAQKGSPAQVTVGMMDDEIGETPVVALKVDKTTITEGEAIQITTELSVASQRTVTVRLSLSGTARLRSDYTLSSTRITLAPGTRSGSVTLRTVDDQLFEGDETVTVQIAAVSGATLGGYSAHALILADNESAPTIRLAAQNTKIPERGGITRIMAVLSNATRQAVTVHLDRSEITADTTDYRMSSSKITIRPGKTVGSTSLVAVNDSFDEPAKEEVVISILDVEGEGTADPTPISVEIMDDDPTPQARFIVSQRSLDEQNGKTLVRIALTGRSRLPITGTLQFNGTATFDFDKDYEVTSAIGCELVPPVTIPDLSPSSLIFTLSPGGRECSFAVHITDDNRDEEEETIVMSLDNMRNAVSSGVQKQTISIRDDDAPPQVTLSAELIRISEKDGVTILRATPDELSGKAIQVMLKQTGTAATLSNKTLTILPEAESGAVILTAVDNSLYEEDNEVTVSIESVTNATVSGKAVQLTIVNDDPPPTTTTTTITTTTTATTTTTTTTIPIPTTTTTLQGSVRPSQWIHQFGTEETDRAYGVAVDPERGDIYVVGDTRGHLDENRNAGWSDPFLIKYNAEGGRVWTRQFGTPSDETAMDVAVDKSGAIYVTGNIGGSDPFIVKYNMEGTQAWTNQFETNEFDNAYGVAVDPARGAIYMTGYTEGSLDGHTNAGYSDLFLIKYDTQGNKAWTRQLGTHYYDMALDVAVDPQTGAIYITGFTGGSLDENPHGGYSDLFLMKYDIEGIRVWTHQLGLPDDEIATGMAVDPLSGAIYLTGYIQGDPQENPDSGWEWTRRDIFLAKYDINGTPVWMRSLEATPSDTVSGVAVDPTRGAIYVTGETSSGLDGNISAGGYDFFLIRYNPEGNKEWTTQLGSPGWDSAGSVAVDQTSGAIYVTGDTSGTLDGEMYRDMNAGSSDIFLVRYSGMNPASLLPVTLTGMKAGTGDGKITSRPAGIDCGEDCSEVYGVGTSVLLTATPALGSAFVEWKGNCEGTDASMIVTTMANRSCTAIFNQQPPLSISLTLVGNGQVGLSSTSQEGITGCSASCRMTYPYGTPVTLTAAPASGWAFRGWGEVCPGTDDCTVTVVADLLVTVTFDRPSTPIGLSAKAGEDAMTLTWDANPTSDNVQSYTLYMAAVSWTSPWTETLSNAMKHSVPCCTFTHTGLSKGAIYSFRITASNDAGESSESSDVSAVLSEWTRQFGTWDYDSAAGVAVDQTIGAIYVTGSTSGNLDGHTNAGSLDLFLIKYDASGIKQWSRQFGSADYDDAWGVAVDSTTGAIYVTGRTFGSLDGNVNAGADDIFLIKYNPSGEKEWTRQFGSANSEIALGGVAVDQNRGAIYITGWTSGSLDGNTSAGGWADIFLIKYDTSGEKQWTRQLGSPDSDYARGVAVDPTTGAIYVTGDTWGNLDGNIHTGGYDLFLTQYNASGEKQWTRQRGSSNTDIAYDVAVDPNTGAIYVTGDTSGNIDGNTYVGANFGNAFLIRYDRSGAMQWIRQFGSMNSDGAYSIAVNPNTGAIYVTGETWGTLDGNANTGGYDLFLTQYNASGEKQWTRQSGSTEGDSARGVATDAIRGFVYVVGNTQGNLDGNTNAGYSDIFLVKYSAMLTLPTTTTATTTPLTQPLLSLIPMYGGCTSEENSHARITKRGMEIVLEGTVIVANPSYTLQGKIEQSGSTILVQLVPVSLGGMAIQCIADIPFVGSLGPLAPGTYQVLLTAEFSTPETLLNQSITLP